STGSEPGFSFSRTMSAGGLGIGPNPGANLFSAMPVNADDRITNATRSSLAFAPRAGAALAAGTSTTGSVTAAVAAAAPVSTVRRVMPPESSLPGLASSVRPRCDNSLISRAPFYVSVCTLAYFDWEHVGSTRFLKHERKVRLIEILAHLIGLRIRWPPL